MTASQEPRAAMTSEQFVAWRKMMDWTQPEAARELDLSVRTVALYEQGRREDTGRPVSIPRTVALACAALAAGIKEYSGPSRAPDIKPRLNVGNLLTATGDLREDVLAWWREAFTEGRMASPIIVMNGFARFETENDALMFNLAWSQEMASGKSS